MASNSSSDRAARLRLARQIMTEIVHDNRHGELPVRDDDNNAPIVVALPDDLLSEVIGRVKSAGGKANTFTVADNGDLLLLDIQAVTPGSAGRVGDPDGPTPVHQDVTFGMFTHFALQRDEGVQFAIRMNYSNADVGAVRKLQHA